MDIQDRLGIKKPQEPAPDLTQPFSNKPRIPHYYGDTVRAIFLIAAAVMIIGVPFVHTYISLPIFLSMLGVLILGILAALTSPRYKWTTILNTFISIAALGVFQWYAIEFFHVEQLFFFVINQALSLMFLMAIYYSIKTWRGWFKI